MLHCFHIQNNPNLVYDVIRILSIKKRYTMLLVQPTTHGKEYEEYKNTTGRYIPRFLKGNHQ